MLKKNFAKYLYNCVTFCTFVLLQSRRKMLLSLSIRISPLPTWLQSKGRGSFFL